ncbi:unnamed protein product [Rotaria sordida]|uniref:TRPM SLOG domain-containing protein n=2 Tax=Rotaria sordida TaxID=392033 RepID=A0A815RGN9_9BILA|nr:unnamed protein product [Rotaria sordida]
MAVSVTFTQHKRQPEIPVKDLKNLPINYRVCYKFAPKEVDKDICECNRIRRDHTDITANDQSKWHISTHTKQYKNTSDYGRLINDALYVRLDIETKLEIIHKLLFNFWKISKPTLIISIIGNATSYSLSDRSESKFLNSIVNICIKTNVWMITNGLDIGIVQLVGQAVNKARLKNPDKVVAIGICKWGSIKDREVLIKREKQNTNKKDQYTSKTSDVNNDENNIQNGACDLEMKHTHYLMLDDGTYRTFDTKDFRSRLCKHITTLEMGNTPRSM